MMSDTGSSFVRSRRKYPPAAMEPESGMYGELSDERNTHPDKDMVLPVGLCTSIHSSADRLADVPAHAISLMTRGREATSTDCSAWLLCWLSLATAMAVKVYVAVSSGTVYAVLVAVVFEKVNPVHAEPFTVQVMVKYERLEADETHARASVVDAVRHPAEARELEHSRTEKETTGAGTAGARSGPHDPPDGADNDDTVEGAVSVAGVLVASCADSGRGMTSLSVSETTTNGGAAIFGTGATGRTATDGETMATASSFGGVISERTGSGGAGAGSAVSSESSKSSSVTELPYKALAMPKAPRLNVSTRLPSQERFLSYRTLVFCSFFFTPSKTLIASRSNWLVQSSYGLPIPKMCGCGSFRVCSGTVASSRRCKI